MKLLPGCAYVMGSDLHYPEETPARRVAVDAFWIDETPVTNDAFAAFVANSGYVTLAERAPDPDAYPGIAPEMACAGSLLFTPPGHCVDLRDAFQWWRFSFGTYWARPYGPDSNLDGLSDHPVVHVAYEDAAAFAVWAGKRLPTEAEWEYAARGGMEQAQFAWGEELAPDGLMLANYWQGEFPNENLALDGYERTSPVHAFPTNGFGLYDIVRRQHQWHRFEVVI